MSAPTGWLSYDSVADTYERVAVPWFTALAKDLAAAVQPQPGERLLDVGTGTGLAASAVLDTEPTVTAVGVDPSPGMLAKVDGTRITRVAAMAPGLPFPSASFDAAIANLCVSHLPDPAAGVAEIAAVIRPGGRFGCTAWGTVDDDRPGCPRGDANRILEQIRAKLGLDLTPPVQAAPWEDWLKDPTNLHRLLTDAGFDPVEVSPHRSPWTFTIGEFLSGWGSEARYRRHAAGEARWRAYVDEASAALRDAVGERIEITNSVWIAVGRRR
jgi:SAM-dependent methyltransferase